MKKYKELLTLARKSIESELNKTEIIVDNNIKEKYSNKLACFVTLTINNQLRGCIGSLEARQELYKDVIENAKNAGFKDFRFLPLTKNELKKIKIEISILTKPEKLNFDSEKDLLNKINKNMGLILKKSGRTSTFLPQVWEQIKDKVEFLEALSQKAGLASDAWKTAEIWFYHIKKVEE